MAPGSLADFRRGVYDRMFRLATRHPAANRVLRTVNRALRVAPPVRFSGWGMTTTHEPPWTTGADDAAFRESLELAHGLTFTGEAGITADSVDTLAWRHWTVAFAVRLAAASVPSGLFGAVECGVADGTTAFFALRELRRVRPEFEFHLYDSWDEIPAESVLGSERVQAGRYAGLSRKITQDNLSEFAEWLVWHEGLLPEALSEPPPPPERVAYLHIDLNVAGPTRAVSERLWDHLDAGGVILFDDYGWLGFEDTKAVVDDFAADHPDAVLLKMPTAQALLIRAARHSLSGAERRSN